MIEVMKKSLFAGVGLANLTKSKAEELGKSMAENFNLNSEEGEKLVHEVLEKSESARRELQGTVEAMVMKVMERMDLARQSELEALKAKVEALEKELQSKSS